MHVLFLRSKHSREPNVVPVDLDASPIDQGWCQGVAEWQPRNRQEFAVATALLSLAPALLNWWRRVDLPCFSSPEQMDER